jgi:hypothetical protein
MSMTTYNIQISLKKYIFFAFDTYMEDKTCTYIPNPVPFLKHVANKGGWPDLHVLRKRPKENLQNCEYVRFAEFARRRGNIGNSRQSCIGLSRMKVLFTALQAILKYALGVHIICLILLTKCIYSEHML